MENQYNVTTASEMQGAHNMPCKLCGKVDWKQDLKMVEEGFPMWDCQTKGCVGVLWSD